MEGDAASMEAAGEPRDPLLRARDIAAGSVSHVVTDHQRSRERAIHGMISVLGVGVAAREGVRVVRGCAGHQVERGRDGQEASARDPQASLMRSRSGGSSGG